jgi:hypothetical protein
MPEHESGFSLMDDQHDKQQVAPTGIAGVQRV